jgi:hypothetical protein
MRDSIWRDHAAEMSALAEDMGNANATRLMFDLANVYEKLADRDLMLPSGHVAGTRSPNPPEPH